MGRHFWIIFGIVLVIGLAVFMFFIWRNQTENGKTPPGELATGEKVQPSQQPGQPGQEQQKEPEKALAGGNLIIEKSKGLEFKPFFPALGGSASGGEDELEIFAETFLEQFSALVNPPVSGSALPPEQPQATSNEIILSLTDEEFHFLYPDTFITSLVEGQNSFVKEYDPAYVPILKIETDSQVRLIEEKIVASLLSLGMITEEDAQRFIETIHVTLPQLQLSELKNRKSSTLNQFFMFSFLSPRPVSKGYFFTELMEKLYNAFIPTAQAGYCGSCHTQPECFQAGAPAPVGYNFWKAFCRCTGCYSGQGCLDSCQGGSAIYDPMTGICGCG
jgi:hypothetical protein